MKHYVYIITNIIEDKHYIGVRSSKNPIKDLGIKYFSSSTDKEFMLEQQEFPERFEYKILEVFSSRDLAVAKEIELHDKYDVAVNESFYNRAKQTSSGFCTYGMTVNHTEETIRKIKLAQSGEKGYWWNKPRSDETKRKIGLSTRGSKHHFWGKNHTEESKLKMSLSLTGDKNPNWGKPKSDETKRKMSLAQSGDKNHMWGKTISEETREKLRLAKLGKPKSEKTRENMRVAQQNLAIKNAFRFIIHDPNEILIHDEVVVDFAKFCKDNKYPAVSFRVAHKTNEPVKGGKFKGWTVQRTEQQTKGE